MAQGQLPPTIYNQPYPYQPTQPQNPNTSVRYAAPISQPNNGRNAVRLPLPPLGRTPYETVIFPGRPNAFIPPTFPPPPANLQPNVASGTLPANVQLPPPPPNLNANNVHPYHEFPPAPQYYPVQQPPPPIYHEDFHLPRLPRRRKRHERQHHDRHRHSHPIIVTYFGRRHDVQAPRRRKKWYN